VAKAKLTHPTTDASVPSGREVSSLLLKIDRRLSRQYKSPRLGNPKGPLDDLVFILLSARTRGVVHERIYGQLKAAYPTWSGALKAGEGRLSKVLKDAGLSKKKGAQIFRILKTLNERFGEPSLDHLQDLSNDEVEKFLCNLPGVGKKTARCVMLCTLDRAVFPVDVHVLRILSYFGLVNPRVRLEYAQDPLQKIVPPRIRYSLHVNLVAHGRDLCRPRAHNCVECPLRDLCPQREDG
jgi:endonuclease III